MIWLFVNLRGMFSEEEDVHTALLPGVHFEEPATVRLEHLTIGSSSDVSEGTLITFSVPAARTAVSRRLERDPRHRIGLDTAVGVPLAFFSWIEISGKLAHDPPVGRSRVTFRGVDPQSHLPLLRSVEVYIGGTNPFLGNFSAELVESFDLYFRGVSVDCEFDLCLNGRWLGPFVAKAHPFPDAPHLSYAQAHLRFRDVPESLGANAAIQWIAGKLGISGNLPVLPPSVSTRVLACDPLVRLELHYRPAANLVENGVELIEFVAFSRGIAVRDVCSGDPVSTSRVIATTLSDDPLHFPWSVAESEI